MKKQWNKHQWRLQEQSVQGLLTYFTAGLKVLLINAGHFTVLHLYVSIVESTGKIIWLPRQLITFISCWTVSTLFLYFCIFLLINGSCIIGGYLKSQVFTDSSLAIHWKFPQNKATIQQTQIQKLQRYKVVGAVGVKFSLTFWALRSSPSCTMTLKEMPTDQLFFSQCTREPWYYLCLLSANFLSLNSPLRDGESFLYWI